MLRQDCSAYNEKVSLYTEQFGYSTVEAEKKAARNVRSVAAKADQTTGLSNWSIFWIVTGTCLVALTIAGIAGVQDAGHSWKLFARSLDD